MVKKIKVNYFLWLQSNNGFKIQTFGTVIKFI